MKESTKREERAQNARKEKMNTEPDIEHEERAESVMGRVQSARRGSESKGTTLSHCLLYSFSSTQAGCTSEAQSWEKMVKFVESQNKETAWSKTVCTNAKLC